VLRGGGIAGEGVYASISSGGLYAGSGYYVMARDQLERFRDAVAGKAGPKLEDAVAEAEDAGLEVTGDTLQTAPRGYPKDHERIELLRHKSIVAGRRLDPGKRGITRNAALEHVAGAWRAAAPITRWLDKHVGPSTIPPDTRGRRR
jgi:uncharacterized protein (DUF2461 family)